MTLQHRGGQKLNLSQSMSRNMIVNLQLPAMFTRGVCVTVTVLLRGDF